MGHGNEAVNLPKGFEMAARSQQGAVAAVKDNKRRFYGLQYHPEINLDAVKYVKNQVQTIGATVKKFYSDVMQDLHPKFYIDPVKVAAADLSFNPYAHSEMKLKANAKKDGRETDWKSIDDSEVISGKANTGVCRRPSACRRGSSKDDLGPLLPAHVAPIAGANNHLSSFS